MLKTRLQCLISNITILICVFILFLKSGRLCFNTEESDIPNLSTKGQKGPSLTRATPSRDISLKRDVATLQETVDINGKTKPFYSHIQENSNVTFHREDTSPEKTRKLPFLKNYRNPCWRELNENGNGSRIRCLPYFYLVGASKCGTTDLYERLIKHQLITSMVTKEIHWIAKRRFRVGRNCLSSYLTYFEKAVPRINAKVGRDNYHPMVFGDCSPTSLSDNRCLLKPFSGSNITTMPFTNAEIIHNLYPDAKILIILRNPIKRLYSEYLYFRKSGKSVEEFHQEVVTCINQHTDCMQIHSIQYCAYFLKAPLEINIGFYHIYIEDYLKVFGREQVNILELEDYSQHMLDSMIDVFSFLGIGKPSNEIMARINEEKRYNTRTKDDERLGDMLPKTWQYLAEFYKPYNERLVKLLGNKFRYY